MKLVSMPSEMGYYLYKYHSTLLKQKAIPHIVCLLWSPLSPYSYAFMFALSCSVWKRAGSWRATSTILLMAKNTKAFFGRGQHLPENWLIRTRRKQSYCISLSQGHKSKFIMISCKNLAGSYWISNQVFFYKLVPKRFHCTLHLTSCNNIANTLPRIIGNTGL